MSVTGRTLQLERDARIQERSLGLDSAQVMRATLRRQHELEALLEDEDTIEPVKEEAQRDLIDLYRYEEENTARTRDNAQRCVRAVRMAIKRFYDHVAGSTDPDGSPIPTLRRFAAHLEKHLLIPSSRYSGRRVARTGLAGCFTYEPPPGVTWLNR